MSVGLSQDKSAIDGRAGALCKQLRDDFAAVQDFQTWLSGKTDADLVTLGYAQGDVDNLKSTFTQLVALKNVAYGQQTVPSANNFLFFAARLTGVY